jgi:hypothetical protein
MLALLEDYVSHPASPPAVLSRNKSCVKTDGDASGTRIEVVQLV